MRIKVSRFLKNKNNADEVERLFLLALLHLYEGDNILSRYLELKYKAAAHIKACITAAPQETEAQGRVRSLVPAGHRTNLYISIHKNTIPTHAMSLVRKNNRFCASTINIRKILSGDPPRDGIMASWASITPPSELAASMPVKFSRIIRGGRATQYMIDETTTDWELRRQLTHCCLVSDALCAVHKNQISVWNSQALGKAVFTFTPTPDTDPLLTPYNFEGLRVRPDNRPGTKFRTKVYGDVPAPLLQDRRGHQPRYFAVQIKDATRAEFQDARTEGFVKEILEYQIVPLLGVLDQEHQCTSVYALHYDPETGELYPTLVSTLKQRINEIPRIQRWGRGFQPNVLLLEKLKDILLQDQPEGAYCHQERIDGVKNFFSQFSNLKTPLEVLQAYGVEFYDHEKEKLERLLA